MEGAQSPFYFEQEVFFGQAIYTSSGFAHRPQEEVYRDLPYGQG
jgi:hypothetical protein